MTASYEEALYNYYKTLHRNSMPLLCWDFLDSPKLEINQFHNIQQLWSEKVNFHQIVHFSHREIVITNTAFEIIFATEGLFGMTGYYPKEVIGKSPKLFQGPLTCQTTKHKIREAMSLKQPFKVEILNYKKNGSTYMCEVEAYPKFTAQGEFINYIAFEKDAASPL